MKTFSSTQIVKALEEFGKLDKPVLIYHDNKFLEIDQIKISEKNLFFLIKTGKDTKNFVPDAIDRMKNVNIL